MSKRALSISRDAPRAGTAIGLFESLRSLGTKLQNRWRSANATLRWRWLPRRPAHSAASDTGYMPAKRLNSKLNALKILVQDDSIETMPQWVGFSATTFCNLRCPHCQTHGTDETR